PGLRSEICPGSSITSPPTNDPGERCSISSTRCSLDGFGAAKPLLELGIPDTSTTVTVRQTVPEPKPDQRASELRLPNLDLDGDAGGEVEALQGVHGLGTGVEDVEQALVHAHLEVLARVLVL